MNKSYIKRPAKVRERQHNIDIALREKSTLLNRKKREVEGKGNKARMRRCFSL